jgi:hypothetical protein
MLLPKRENTINDRTISGSRALAWLKVMPYLRLKFSIKIATALLQ